MKSKQGFPDRLAWELCILLWSGWRTKDISSHLAVKPPKNAWDDQGDIFKLLRWEKRQLSIPKTQGMSSGGRFPK